MRPVFFFPPALLFFFREIGVAVELKEQWRTKEESSLMIANDNY